MTGRRRATGHHPPATERNGVLTDHFVLNDARALHQHLHQVLRFRERRGIAALAPQCPVKDFAQHALDLRILGKVGTLLRADQVPLRQAVHESDERRAGQHFGICGDAEPRHHRKAVPSMDPHGVGRGHRRYGLEGTPRTGFGQVGRNGQQEAAHGG